MVLILTVCPCPFCELLSRKNIFIDSLSSNYIFLIRSTLALINLINAVALTHTYKYTHIVCVLP